MEAMNDIEAELDNNDQFVFHVDILQRRKELPSCIFDDNSENKDIALRTPVAIFTQEADVNKFIHDQAVCAHFNCKQNGNGDFIINKVLVNGKNDNINNLQYKNRCKLLSGGKWITYENVHEIDGWYIQNTILKPNYVNINNNDKERNDSENKNEKHLTNNENLSKTIASQMYVLIVTGGNHRDDESGFEEYDMMSMVMMTIIIIITIQIVKKKKIKKYHKVIVVIILNF